jgi:hypothetical protein
VRVAFYVNDPDQPVKKIDSTILQVKYPDRILDPVKILGYLKRDVWTRREALLLLAGYDPITQWNCSDTRMSLIGPAMIFFLDGTNSAQLLNEWHISHPRGYDNLDAFTSLLSWAEHQALSETHPPPYWIEWARSKGFAPYWLEYAQSWNGTTNEASPMPQAAAPALAGTASDGPLALTTSDIAFCFDGVRWSEKEWRKPLGDKRKWLQNCVVTPGQQGVSQTRWNPVLIASWLVRNGHARANSIRARFQTKPQLKPWLEAWKTYEADYLST